ncbi:hypothetical protein B0H16DRAFT_1693857 [Mycena metata]|uniref:Uncharacterized protein n=1 Tax=Mycena metata TaxID=1033252 RepID=A0AAD7IHJ2_9AGAR|nr:hypothetical protein B0H16DRAFT_1693857 [Mycena metata]
MGALSTAPAQKSGLGMYYSARMILIGRPARFGSTSGSKRRRDDTRKQRAKPKERQGQPKAQRNSANDAALRSPAVPRRLPRGPRKATFSFLCGCLQSSQKVEGDATTRTKTRCQHDQFLEREEHILPHGLSFNLRGLGAANQSTARARCTSAPIHLEPHRHVRVPSLWSGGKRSTPPQCSIIMIPTSPTAETPSPERGLEEKFNARHLFAQSHKENAPLGQTTPLSALDKGIAKGRKRTITLVNGGPRRNEASNYTVEDELATPPAKRAKTAASASAVASTSSAAPAASSSKAEEKKRKMQVIPQ